MAPLILRRAIIASGLWRHDKARGAVGFVPLASASLTLHEGCCRMRRRQAQCKAARSEKRRELRRGPNKRTSPGAFFACWVSQPFTFTEVVEASLASTPDNFSSKRGIQHRWFLTPLNPVDRTNRPSQCRFSVRPEEKRAVSEPGIYLLGRGEAEEERLRRQITNLALDSDAQLDRIGIKQGERVLDLGCGPGGVLHLLGKRVGTTGSVLGIERSPHFVHLARRFVAENALAQVEVREGDAYNTGLARGSFDGAHMRRAR